MSKAFFKAGHFPTLAVCFLYFDLSFAVWVLLAPLAVLIANDLHLQPDQKGLMVATPVLAGALLRVLNGVLIGQWKARRVGIAMQLVVIVGLLLAWWLLAAATSSQAFGWVQWFIGTPIGLLILLGYTWALMHHMLGGIRHFIWDLGHGLGPGDRDRIARANMIGSIVLTLLLWIVGYWALGGTN